MSWFPIFRLGPAGGEIDFVCQVIDVQVNEDNVEVAERNLSGAMLRAYLRANVPDLTLTLARLQDSDLAILRGLQSSLSALNFIYNKTLAVKYLMATSASTTSVVIPLTSASGVTITGVFLRSDAAQSGANYYSGGSTFDASTGTITLASALPDANTDVWVNYTFSGLSCWAKVQAKPHQGAYSGLWQATLTLTGA